MERGEVGIVLVRDVSRVSRNPLDAERFRSKAMAAGVLIEAQGRIFDTASRDLLELFGFRMQSMIALVPKRDARPDVSGCQGSQDQAGLRRLAPAHRVRQVSAW